LDAASVVDNAQVALIAPSMGNGYFINSAFERQADFLQEMFDVMREILPLSRNRDHNALIGISMGGFGALRWALESEAFGSVATISGVFDCRIPLDARMMKNRTQRALHTTFEGVMRRFLLDDTQNMRPDADIRLLLERHCHSTFPRVQLYCGEQDYLSLPQTAYVKDICTRYDCPVEIYLSEGDHNQLYWRNAFHEAVVRLYSDKN